MRKVVIAIATNRFLTLPTPAAATPAGGDQMPTTTLEIRPLAATPACQGTHSTPDAPTPYPPSTVEPH